MDSHAAFLPANSTRTERFPAPSAAVSFGMAGAAIESAARSEYAALPGGSARCGGGMQAMLPTVEPTARVRSLRYLLPRIDTFSAHC
jgi:hypothetical protein